MSQFPRISASGFGNTVNTLGDIILVSPKEQIGIRSQKFTDSPGFLFHITGEEVAQLTADITDHFVEDNTSLQDHIALRPEIVTVNGYIGELSDLVPPLLAPFQEAVERLAPLTALQPGLSRSAIIALNRAKQTYALAEKALKSAKAVKGFLTGQSTVQATKQQEAFVQFYEWYQSRGLFTVQTPWNLFTDMAIQSIRASQNEDTRMITDFEIVFKKMRFAKSRLNLQFEKIGAGRNFEATTAIRNMGVATLVPSTIDPRSVV